MAKTKKKVKEDLVRLDMTFEQAMKKALNTRLPKSEKKIKSTVSKLKKSD